MKQIKSTFRVSSEEAVQSLNWTIRLRWLLVSIFLLTFAMIHNIIPQDILMIIVGCCILEFIYNLILVILNKQNFRFLNYLLYLSPIGDMAIIVLGVYLSGKLTFGSGIMYIIPFVYSIPIITTSVILSIGAGLIVAAIASMLFGLLALYGFFQGIFEGVMVFLILEKIAYFFIIAFLSGYLAHAAKKKSRELEESKHNLELKNQTLIKTQAKLIRSEKLASIAQMTVSLNHEINNPLTSVLADIQYAIIKLTRGENGDFPRDRVVSCLQTAEIAALRIKTLMEDLRKITNPEVEDYVPGVKMINIKKSIGKVKEPAVKKPSLRQRTA